MKTPSNDDVIMREYRSPMTSSDAETDFKPVIIIIIYLINIRLGLAVIEKSRC